MKIQTCPDCKSVVNPTNGDCPRGCVRPEPVRPAPPPAPPPSVKAPSCQHCGTGMRREKIVEKDMGLQALGVVLFLVGIGLCFAFFPLGAIAGIALIVASARIGYSKKPGWKCGNCGYSFKI